MKVRPDPNQSSLGRIFANVMWLLGGKGFGAVCSIVYLAILTRTLGLKDFGHFSLIFSTAQALIAIAGFQTWQVVVRYGAAHVYRKDWDKFGRLGLFAGALDAIGAICGCAIAAVIFFGFAHMLDLNPEFVHLGFWFSCASLFALVSAPTGIVRALGRFDTAVYVEALVPLGRLIAALLIWWTGPSVGRFLFAWALIDIIESIAYWIAARRLCPEAVRWRHLAGWRRTLAENPGLGRFFMATYGSSTLNAVVKQGPLLAVGALVGTKAAGVFRLASQLAQALSKLSTMLTRAIYPEIAKARVTEAAGEFRKLALRTSLIAGLSGAVVVGVSILAGRQALALIGGEAFESGAVVLIPLAIAASLDLASVAFEPVLHASGHAGRALAARLLGAIVLGLGILALHGGEEVGIAWAVSIGAAAVYLVMGWMALHTLRRHPEELEAPDPHR
ncbi:MAG: lipopolysaccharide biosynthesis protein [Novosphingobium sp.]|nr:lipopolysaccharide biosynthesis protein [Novosphingobium sp.]